MPTDEANEFLSLSRGRLSVLKAVCESPGYAAFIARKLKISRSTALAHLRGLEKDLLVRVATGDSAHPWIVYHPTEKGARLLALLGRGGRAP